MIMGGTVGIFYLLNKQQVFLQIYSTGDVINERSALTPFSTDYGAVVLSDQVELLTFSASTLSDDTDFQEFLGFIGRNMMLKLAHIELIKQKYSLLDPTSLKEHQERLLTNYKINLVEVGKKIAEAQNARKYAKFELIRNAPVQSGIKESKFNVDMLATQHFDHKRGVKMDASKLKSQLYLQQLVALMLTKGVGMRTGNVNVVQDELQREADRKSMQSVQKRQTVKGQVEERDMGIPDQQVPESHSHLITKMKQAGDNFNNTFKNKFTEISGPKDVQQSNNGSSNYNPIVKPKGDDFGLLAAINKASVNNPVKKASVGRMGGLPL